MGKQWSWDFNYVDEQVHETGAQAILTGEPGAEETIPTLYLPVGERVQFYLTARDVIHSFWVPQFLQKMDMIPGRVNTFQVTPTQEGTFKGKCAELCGAYHSAMLFNVKVVSRSEYDAHMAELKAKGQTGLLPNGLSRQQLMKGQESSCPRREGLTMSAVVDSGTMHRTAEATRATHRLAPGSTVVKWITTTDHKVIGNLYFITSFIWFLLGGAMALVIRAELLEPGLQLVDNPDQFNQLFTMHGTIMLLLFATPLFAGFANALMPLQIGAPDVSFPRLNMFAYWLYLFGGLIAAAGFLTPGGAAAFGWFAYAPLSDSAYSPGVGGDLWVFGLALGGFGTILGAVNFITTILTMRAPGMTMFRMPVFTWTVLITSILILLIFPALAAALFALGADRRFGAHVFGPDNGGPTLFQHIFWFFGHPEVYVIALPFFGIISEVLPVFSRKPIFGYKTLVAATIAIAALSVAVWAHHMYVTGQILLPFFAIMTMLIAVPTGVKFFNWIGTMWGGKLSFDTPLIWALGFLTTFLFGGLTGVILASPALDFQLSDSYFVVAHFHYVVFGTVVFAMFAGFYFWWPKLTGRMLNARPGKIHFWMLFIGFHDLPHPAPAGHLGHAAALRRLPPRGRLHLRQPGLDRRRVPARRLDDPFLYNVYDVERTHRSSRPTTRGAMAPRWNGRRRARRRGTTSTRFRGSARSAPPSTCTTPRPPPVPHRAESTSTWAVPTCAGPARPPSVTTAAPASRTRRRPSRSRPMSTTPRSTDR